ncbi:MAG: hypothetical protein P8Z35_25960, partial [Ignavibacteriaceae bacterium]
CKGKINPVSINLSHPSPGYCTFQGLEIEFADTCSYDFVTGFLAGFDSVTIKSSLLGGTVYVLADSGDFNYWYQYFKEDSAVQYITASVTSSDSLILKLALTGKKSINEEEEILSQIKNLTIINFEETPKFVDVDIPENNITWWAENFRKYPFIVQILIISVCVN